MQSSSSTYSVATESDFDNFKTIIYDLNGFVEVVKNDLVTIWSKPGGDSPINMTRMHAKFKDLPPENLYDVIHENDYRPTWDEKMIEIKTIEQIDFYNQISYYSAKAPWPVANRDFVNLSSWKDDTGNGEWIIMNRKVIHKDAPEKKDMVRAETLITGYIIKRLESGCEMMYITQTDPKGNIPTWLINMLTTKYAPSFVETIYKAALKYPEWKSKNNPNNKPWLTVR